MSSVLTQYLNYFLRKVIQVIGFLGNTSAVLPHGLCFGRVAHDVVHGIRPTLGVAVGNGDAGVFGVDVHIEVGVAAADYRDAQGKGLDQCGETHRIGKFQTRDDDALRTHHFTCQLFGDDSVGKMNLDVATHLVTGDDGVVINVAASVGNVDGELFSGFLEGFQQGVEVAVFLAGGDESGTCGHGELLHHGVVEGEISPPMAERHLLRLHFPGLQGIGYELAAEEKHVVYAAVEEPGDAFLEFAARAGHGGVVPDDDRLAEQAQGAEQDDGFDAAEGTGIENVEFLLAAENFPGGIEHQAEAAGVVAVAMHDGVYAGGFEVCGAVEQVAGKIVIFPGFIAFGGEACVVEVNA